MWLSLLLRYLYGPLEKGGVTAVGGNGGFKRGVYHL